MNRQIRVNFYDYQFLLLSIATLLIAFNWYVINYNSTYLLFWCAALYIAWKKKDKLNLHSNLLSTAVGLILIAWLLFRGAVSEFDSDVITRIYPLISVAGICLLATKPTKIFQYWREIFIVSMTGIPWELIFAMTPVVSKISILDAKIARLMLWYVGFDVQRSGDLVILPKGAIKIASSCSSFDLLGLLWQSAIVLCLCFTVANNKKIILFSCSTLIAFVVNGLRLCLMAVLVASKSNEAFYYWHGEDGAEIFTTAAILILAAVYWWWIKEPDEVINLSDSNTLPSEIKRIKSQEERV